MLELFDNGMYFSNDKVPDFNYGCTLLYAEQVIAGLDRVAATMKMGERAIVTISHEYGFGNVEAKRDLATVPSCAKLYYEVEMMDFIKVMTCDW